MPQSIAAEVNQERYLGADQYVIMTDYLRDSMDCMNIQFITSKVGAAIRRFVDVAEMGLFLNDAGTLVPIIAKEYGLSEVQCVMEQVLKTGEAVHSPVIWFKDESTLEELRKLGGESVLSIPIHQDDSILAVLTVVLRSEEIPRQRVMEFFTSICGFLGVQLKHALMSKKMETDLKNHNLPERDMDVIFCSSGDMIGVFSVEGYAKRVNPAFEGRMGYSQRELFDKPITAFAHPEDREYVQYVLDHIAQEGVMGGICQRFVGKGDKVVFLESNIRYIAESGDIVAIARDVTDQREVEAKNMALEQSIELERMKTEFFSNISHEFKTPINIILSSVDLLKLKLKRNDEPLYNEQYKKFFTYMEQNSFKLLRLINNLLDCTKIDSGALKLLAKNCFIVPFVRQVVETTESYADAHGIDIRFMANVEEDFLLYCDQDKVDRILLNLISNSIKHTKEGGHIVVSMTVTPTHLALSVVDDGEGIPEKMLPHIFEKFRVYEEGFVKSCDGTGVGLSIVKGLVELHQGTITVKSRRGEGSEFTITLSRKLKKSMTSKRVKMVSQQQDNELHQSRLQMEMSNIK